MKSRALLVVACIALPALSACGGNSSEKAATQLAAKVDGNDISVHLVNGQLARLGAIPEAQRPIATKNVLEGLIDQQLLIQQAIEKKLDRDPEVLAAIENTRRQILAQAYVQKTLGTKARPSDEEVRKYYADNAALFAQRKIYRLREVSARVPADRMEEFKALAARIKTLSEAAPWLREHKIEFAANEAVRPAEKVPLNSLERLSAMKDGEIGVFASENGAVSLLQVAATQSAPVAEKDALPVIEQYFVNLKRDQLAREELKRLRENAKIEYLGEYAKLPQAPAAVTAPTAATAAAASDTASAPAALTAAPQAPDAATSTPATTPADAAKAAPTAIDKGVAGLR